MWAGFQGVTHRPHGEVACVFHHREALAVEVSGVAGAVPVSSRTFPKCAELQHVGVVPRALERESERQGDRETERDRGRERQRQRGREAERQRVCVRRGRQYRNHGHGKRGRETARQRDRERVERKIIT